MVYSQIGAVTNFHFYSERYFICWGIAYSTVKSTRPTVPQQLSISFFLGQSRPLLPAYFRLFNLS